LIGHINSDAKTTGKRSAGNPHAAFDEAGAGNSTHNVTAPVPDPTGIQPSENNGTLESGIKITLYGTNK
jgi:hypothetical protein